MTETLTYQEKPLDRNERIWVEIHARLQSAPRENSIFFEDKSILK